LLLLLLMMMMICEQGGVSQVQSQIQTWGGEAARQAQARQFEPDGVGVAVLALCCARAHEANPFPRKAFPPCLLAAPVAWLDARGEENRTRKE
jgi:hypothetical protein